MIFSFDSPGLSAAFSLLFGCMEAALLGVFLSPLLAASAARFGDSCWGERLAGLAGALLLAVCAWSQTFMNMWLNVLLHYLVVVAVVKLLLRATFFKGLYTALVFHLCMDIAKTVVLDMLPFLRGIKNSLDPGDKLVQIAAVGLIALALVLGLRRLVCRPRLRALTPGQTAAVFLPALPYLYVKFVQYRSFAVENMDLTQDMGMLNFVMCILALMMVVLTERTLDAMLEQEEAVRARLSLERQRMQMEEHMKKLDEINRLSHDMRNHLATIAAMSTSGDIQGYIARLLPSLRPVAVSSITGCEPVDVLLSRKMDECARIGASLVPCVSAEASGLLSGVPAPELCTIFGNLLDNAIEAVAALPQERSREIVLRLSHRGGFLIIRTENRFDGARSRDAEAGFRTTKQDADAHGYGLRSIADTARSLGGEMTASAENGLFLVNVLLPV